MPIFEYGCEICGDFKEIRVRNFLDSSPEMTCKCGGVLRRKVSLPSQGNFGFKSFWTPHLTGENVEITSMQMKRNLLKRHNLVEAG